MFGEWQITQTQNAEGNPLLVRSRVMTPFMIRRLEHGSIIRIRILPPSRECSPMGIPFENGGFLVVQEQIVQPFLDRGLLELATISGAGRREVFLLGVIQADDVAKATHMTGGMAIEVSMVTDRSDLMSLIDENAQRKLLPEDQRTLALLAQRGDDGKAVRKVHFTFCGEIFGLFDTADELVRSGFAIESVPRDGRLVMSLHSSLDPSRLSILLTQVREVARRLMVGFSGWQAELMRPAVMTPSMLHRRPIMRPNFGRKQVQVGE